VNGETEMHQVVKKLFEEDRIDIFIGYEKGTVPLKSRPLFIERDQSDKAVIPTEAISRLVWNSFCSNNLAAFIPRYYQRDAAPRRGPAPPPTRIGILAKGCDMRSIIALMKEAQAPKENIVIVGVPCRGMIDTRKVEERLGGAEVTGYEETDGELVVTTRGGGKISLDREEMVQECCIECRFPVPQGADHLLAGTSRAPGDGGYDRVREFEAKTPEERWQYFTKEMSKCIRCNACREACPTCYCKECFADQTDPRWIGVSNELSDVMIYHLIRIFHQAGRCTECDACFRACPMGVDLRTFTKKIVKDVDELFGYVTDFSVDSTPPLSTFQDTDADNFITEPE